MTNENTVTGQISKLVPWKSGKGFFVNLEGDDTDYYTFLKLKVNTGDEATFQVTEGSGNFSDKLQITKVLKQDTIPAKKPDTAPVEEPPVTTEFSSEHKFYADKQSLIVQQTCLKAAARIVAASINPAKEYDCAKLESNILRMKDAFFKNIMEIETDENTQEATE